MVKPVDEDPFVQMDHWGVMSTAHGYRLVGREPATNRARVSSPVVAWDSRSQTATTASGRFYKLVGEPDPRVASNLVKAHANRWRLHPGEVALAEPGELEEIGDGTVERLQNLLKPRTPDA